MGMSSQSTPPPPDYTGAAEAQGKSSKENLMAQTYANRPTQVTPWGETSWTPGTTTDPSTGQQVTNWTQTEKLNPQLQAALDDQLKIQAGRSQAAGTLLGQATESFQKPFNWEGLPQSGTFANAGYGGPDLSSPLYKPGQIADQGYQRGVLDSDYSGARNRAEQALYQRQVNMMEPGLTQSEGARRTRLANMGINPEGGSEAWNRAQSSMDTSRNQAYENAMLNAIAGGGAEAQRQQGMDIAAGQYNLGQAQGAQGLDTAREQANLALATGAQNLETGRLNQATSYTDAMNRQRQQGLAEEAYRRGLPLNELNALLTGTQVTSPNMPNFSNAGVAAATPYMDAATQQGNYGLKSSEIAGNADAALMGTIGKIGGAAIGAMAFMSDRRLKKNVVPLGRGWYAFSYLWDEGLHFGVMAQEVLTHTPEAVITHPSGYLMVDYSRL